MVDVDAVADGHGVGEKLEGHGLGDGEEGFGHRCTETRWAARAGTVASPALARAMTRAFCCAHVAHELDDFFVAMNGVGIGVIDGGDHDEGRAFGDEGVGAVLELAARDSPRRGGRRTPSA